VDTQRDPLDVAARALGRRDRSAAEIDDRLARAGIAADTRAEAIETLERIGYVDDARFADARAAALAARGYGDAAIRAELERHRIAADEVATALAALEPEPERARRIVAREGRTGRTARRLAAKGFAADAVESAVGPDVAAGGAELV
jgi:regulatory protein